MTVTSEDNKTIQIGDGVTTTFNFTFPIFEGTDLEVCKYVTEDGELSDPLTITTDYTVTISDTTEGGSITCVETPLSTESILIQRIMDYTQETDIGININFPEKNIENELDKSRMIDIQLKNELERSIKLNSAYDGAADLTLSFPEASKAIGWDSTGLAMTNLSASDLDTTLVSTYGGSLVTSADAETARDVLELGTSDDVEFAKIKGTSFVGLLEATETLEGIARLATDAEATAGTDDTTIMTPLKVASAIGTSGGSLNKIATYTLDGTVSVLDISSTVMPVGKQYLLKLVSLKTRGTDTSTNAINVGSLATVPTARVDYTLRKAAMDSVSTDVEVNTDLQIRQAISGSHTNSNFDLLPDSDIGTSGYLNIILDNNCIYSVFDGQFQSSTGGTYPSSMKSSHSVGTTYMDAVTYTGIRFDIETTNTLEGTVILYEVL